MNVIKYVNTIGFVTGTAWDTANYFSCQRQKLVSIMCGHEANIEKHFWQNWLMKQTLIHYMLFFCDYIGETD